LVCVAGLDDVGPIQRHWPLDTQLADEKETGGFDVGYLAKGKGREVAACFPKVIWTMRYGYNRAFESVVKKIADMRFLA